MYGIFLPGHNRPKSKKAIKEAIASGTNIVLENTSMYGGYDGGLDTAPDGTYTFVGPCPFTKRNFYGNIVKRDGKVKVS